MSNKMHLLELPDCMLEQIFECLSYDEIAKKRLVSFVLFLCVFTLFIQMKILSCVVIIIHYGAYEWKSGEGINLALLTMLILRRRPK